MELTSKEFMAKYGDVPVKFSRYYKYVFYFTAVLDDGSTLEVGVGGNSDDIYRVEVVPELTEPASAQYPNRGSVYKDGKEVESFYDY